MLARRFISLFALATPLACATTPPAAPAEPPAPNPLEELALRCASEEVAACAELRNWFEDRKPDESIAHLLLPVCDGMLTQGNGDDVDDTRAFCDRTGHALYDEYLSSDSVEAAKMSIRFFDASCREFASIDACRSAQMVRKNTKLAGPDWKAELFSGVRFETTPTPLPEAPTEKAPRPYPETVSR